MPADRVQEPPLLNSNAKEALSGIYHTTDTGDGIAVPLRLEPLEQPGTRVIVPYLSPEAKAAIGTKELHRWIQRCWWRAIQIGDLEISVTDETGQSETIKPPAWWESEPWRIGDDRVQVCENLLLDETNNLKIKRVVLLYDENLEADEIDDYGTQYSGVQLLRGQQWIETLDVQEFIPIERRAGFRGFAEFEKHLERALKGRREAATREFRR